MLKSMQATVLLKVGSQAEDKWFTMKLELPTYMLAGTHLVIGKNTYSVQSLKYNVNTNETILTLEPDYIPYKHADRFEKRCKVHLDNGFKETADPRGTAE